MLFSTLINYQIIKIKKKSNLDIRVFVNYFHFFVYLLITFIFLSFSVSKENANEMWSLEVQCKDDKW